MTAGVRGAGHISRGHSLVPLDSLISALAFLGTANSPSISLHVWVFQKRLDGGGFLTLSPAVCTEGPPPSTQLLYAASLPSASPGHDACPSPPRLISSCLFLRVAELGVKSQAPHLQRPLGPLSLGQGGPPLSCSPAGEAFASPEEDSVRLAACSQRRVVWPTCSRGGADSPSESRNSVPIFKSTN